MPDEDMKRAWIYYRVFLKDPADFSNFVSILAKVVSPIVERFDDKIAHFHFFFDSGAYKGHLERASDQGIIKRLENVEDNDNIAFIRLRFLVYDEAEPAIRINLLDLIEKCDEVRGIEQPTVPYGIEEDLDNRFGATRLKDVMQLLESASRLALSFAKLEEPINPPPRHQGGPRCLVHLVSNTLRYDLIPGVVVSTWGDAGFIQTGDQLL